MKSQSTAYIVGPPLTISTWIGFSLGMIGLGIGIYRGEDAAATALILFGVGVLAGLIVVAPWWIARATGENVKPVAYAKEVQRSGPVEIMWPVNGINRNEMGLVTFKSVSYDEMSKIAAHAAFGGRVTIRYLTDLLEDDIRATKFRDELLAAHWADWKSWDHRGNPNITQGIEITEKGETGFIYYLQQTPTPRYDD